jgi:hypothetical protein
MAFCNNNPSYDDSGFGSSDVCGDNYSSLGGFDSCGLLGSGYGGIGLSNYQQGLMADTPSYCNQQQDYAPVKKMYDITDVPTIAKLQYFNPLTTISVDGTNYLNPKIIDTKGQVAPPRGQGPNSAALRYMQEAEAGAVNFAKNVASSQKSYTAQDMIRATKEGYASLAQQLGLQSRGV